MAKPLRERFNLVPVRELEIEVVDNRLTLRGAEAEPTLIRKRGILVHHGTTRTSLDIGNFIRDERARCALAVRGRTRPESRPWSPAGR